MSARGKGWKCHVRTGAGTITCVRTVDLAPRRTATVLVVTRATRKAAGRQVLTRARVTGLGDVRKANDRATARVKVVKPRRR